MEESNWIEVAKYLSNEMGDKEKIDFENWLNSDSENMELFKKIEMDWENFEGLEAEVDTQGAWNKLEGIQMNSKVNTPMGEIPLTIISLRNGKQIVKLELQGKEMLTQINYGN